MSYNFALAFIPNTAPSMIGASSSAVASFDEASSSTKEGPSAAAHGPHTLLVDPTMLMLDVPPFTPVPGTVIVTLSGASDTYVISVHYDNPRLRVFSEHELQEDDGEPLPAEAVFNEIEDPEDAHLEFFCRIAGITPSDLWKLGWAPLAQ
ncbi:hypothetical protein G7068_02265 [Leucobacter viscericola]|uniref:Uncharacterized protein n=1 Tax=Leucobacter viscericola TaxID=2714935 RepID=A0A6G7XC32_9MICO|nr:hypothetical protein [Leucobacter viscericola]QIK62154.1 hypothetical protein G7068_02265 [Leucobacter viscericola]